MACPTFDAGTMKKQALILSLLAVYLIRQSSGYTLDHKHHAEPDLSYVPPTVEVPPPTVAPLCGCTEKGRCGETLRTFTELVIRTQASEVVCGSKAELCCYEDDPWPGYVVRRLNAVTLHSALLLPFINIFHLSYFCRMHLLIWLHVFLTIFAKDRMERWRRMFEILELLVLVLDWELLGVWTDWKVHQYHNRR